MPTKSLVFSTRLQGFRPVIWFGTPIYLRVTQLQKILRERLTDAHAHLLTEPYIPELSSIETTEGKWFSDYINHPISLTQRSSNDQQRLLEELHRKLKDIRELAADLQKSTDNSERQMGELLLRAIEVPDLKYVLTEGDRVVLVLWGFDSDEARRSQFQLSKVVEDKIENHSAPPIAPPPSVSDPKPTPLTPEKEPQVPVNQSNTPPPSLPPVPPKRFDFKKFWWLWLLLLLLAAFLFYRSCGSTSGGSVHLPAQPGVLPAIDTANFYRDPTDTLHPTILGNRLNIFLKKGTNINKFADAFKKKYPDPSVKFVFFDTLYNMLQLEFKVAQREQWRDSLYKFPEVSVVFDEKIFENNRQPSELDFNDATKKWYFEAIGAFGAWDITKGNPNIKVAIIDDGFDPNHLEFKGKIDAAARNIAAGSRQLKPVFEQPMGGVSPHGTHVAATAVGQADNGVGVSGIAPNCVLLPLQIGASNGGGMSTMGIIMAIQYAILQGVSVINLSLGGQIDPRVVRQIAAMPVNQQQEFVNMVISQFPRYKEEQAIFNHIFKEANSHNIVIVKAAGNDNILMEFDAMATTPYTLNVAATGPDGRRASFSCFSANTVSAPGVHIYNAAPNNTYTFLDGTSMASPIVTGAVALIKSQNPNMTPNQIKDLLVRTGTPVINLDKPLGPIIRLDRALGAVNNMPSNDPCQDKIDSLQREIDRLKGIGTTTPAAPPLIIPCNPKDIQFAIGNWRADNTIINDQRQKVQLFFNINANGDGQLKFLESSGVTCQAPIKVGLKNGQLVINQLGSAPCTQGHNSYNSYEFEFISNCNEVAECTAKNKTDKKNVLRFKLFKQ